MLYADITEFVSNPMGTGIQRTVREIFRHWSGRLAACYFDANADGLRVLDAEALAHVLDASASKTAAEKAAAAAEIVTINPGELIGDAAYVLIPEIFFDGGRCAFYARRLARDPSRTIAIIYDILLWTDPAQFGNPERKWHEPYFNLIFSMAHTAHISHETRAAYELAGGAKSTWQSPVIDLGADGIAIGKQTFSPVRKTFVCLGAVETRKRQGDILCAFASLWSNGIEADLVFVGRVVDHEGESLRCMIDAAKERYPRFRHYEAASDEDIVSLLSSARATILVSGLEGYGLPPIESLHAGIPVIVTETMPSIRRLPGLGQIRVEVGRPDQIAASVRRLMDDNQAATLWAEAAAISLPTWKSAAEQVKDWAESVQRDWLRKAVLSLIRQARVVFAPYGARMADTARTALSRRR